MPTTKQLPNSADATQEDAGRFTGYPVSIEIFEGPLDLLLHLVRRREVEIAEVRVGLITDDYLRYLETMSVINVDLAGEFLVMAANLLWIKSRVLLPRDDAPEQEEMVEEEYIQTEEDLRQRLEEYRSYKEASKLLAEAQEMRQKVFLRPLSDEDEIGAGYVPLTDVSLFDMVAALQEMLERTRELPPAIIRTPELTVADCIEDVVLRLQGSPRRQCGFVDLIDLPTTRVVVILIFLAVLELIRRRRIHVSHGGEAPQLVVALLE